MTRSSAWIAVVMVITTVPMMIGSSVAAFSQGEPGLDTSIFARAIQPGEVVRLDVTCACEVARATATGLGRSAPLFPMDARGVWRGLIGIDVEVKPGTYPIEIVVERTGQPPLAATLELSVTAKRFLIRRLRVADRFVNPDPETIARIQQEAARLEALFRIVTARIWNEPFQAFRAPVAEPATGSFGARSVFNGQPRSVHGGMDFGSEAGTPVAAPGAGTVVLAQDLYFTGNTVVIDHGVGIYSVLAHLSTVGVSEGDGIQRGAIIGQVGATGRVTGAHLHWGVRLNGARIDPLSLIAALDK
jgi:murein DD-endopeptidase MepM/ murein hydrolase activator NlpD